MQNKKFSSIATLQIKSILYDYVLPLYALISFLAGHELFTFLAVVLLPYMLQAFFEGISKRQKLHVIVYILAILYGWWHYDSMLVGIPLSLLCVACLRLIGIMAFMIIMHPRNLLALLLLVLPGMGLWLNMIWLQVVSSGLIILFLILRAKATHDTFGACINILYGTIFFLYVSMINQTQENEVTIVYNICLACITALLCELFFMAKTLLTILEVEGHIQS